MSRSASERRKSDMIYFEAVVGGSSIKEVRALGTRRKKAREASY